MKKLLMIIVVCILFSGTLLALPATDVKVITNRDYFPAVYKLFNGAEKSIYVFMFTARIYPDYPDDVNWKLLDALIEAKKRDVDVKVILDASSWNRSNTLQNKQMADALKEGEVEVYYDPLDVTSHPKLLIIDHRYSVVGSTNWSYYAIEKNNEASVIIDSEPVAEAFEEYFNKNLNLSSKKLKMKDLE
jgi:phosphatidylserine/phosphatidylglycerophosphate/cardiolipin synthase-like enzyme